MAHNLPSLPSLPSSARSKNRPCECGCGTLCGNRFAPGHDSKLRAWVMRVERGIIAIEDIGHEGLEAAVARELGLKKPATKAEIKAAKAAAKAEAKRAVEQADIEQAG